MGFIKTLLNVDQIYFNLLNMYRPEPNSNNNTFYVCKK